MLYTQAPKYHDIHSHDPDHNCMFHNEANGYWMQVVIKPASTDCLGSFNHPPPPNKQITVSVILKQSMKGN